MRIFLSTVSGDRSRATNSKTLKYACFILSFINVTILFASKSTLLLKLQNYKYLNILGSKLRFKFIINII